jgi:hypothetical protein
MNRTRRTTRPKQRLKRGSPRTVKKTGHETEKPVHEPLPLYGILGEERPGLSAASGAQEKAARKQPGNKIKQDKKGSDTAPRITGRENLTQNGGGGQHFQHRPHYSFEKAQRHFQAETPYKQICAAFLTAMLYSHDFHFLSSG